MKKYKILVAVPTYGLLPAKFAMSLADLLKHKINKQETIYGTSILRSAIISKGRNLQFFDAKDNDFDYIFYIDSDIVFPQDGLEKLINLNKDVATGLYYQRAYPHRPVVYNLNADKMITNLVEWEDKPFRVDACGAGFLLIKNTIFDIFKEKEYEPFDMIKNGQNEWAGEDTSFCVKCKDNNIEIWVDPSIKLGHIREDIVYKGHFDCAVDYALTSIANQEEQKWTKDTELTWLRKKAAEMDFILEVGAWKGRSTKALLEGCKKLVYTVDHFKGSPKEALHTNILKNEPPLFEQFAHNLTDYNDLAVLKMTSKNASTLFPNKSLDMVFIDGGHTYEEVRQDILLWLPKTKKLICGHDYTPAWINVMKAVNDVLGDVQFHETIWYKYL